MLQDLSHVARSLLRSPLFLCVATLTLGIGVGLNTALFSIVNVMLLKPLPVRAGHELVWLSSASEMPDGPKGNLTYPDVVELGTVETLTGATAYGFFQASLALPEQADRVHGAVVLGNFFDVVGVQPHRGRTIEPRDEQPSSEPVAVISYPAWQRMFGGRDDAIGQSVRVNGQPFTIAGVAAAGFRGPDVLDRTDVWVSIAWASAVIPDVADPRGRTVWWLKGVGRLAPGADVARATVALRTRARAIAQAFPASHEGFTVRVDALRGVAPDDRNEIAPLSTLLLGVTMTVLLIACANVANLLIVRGVGRSREMAIRAALGASRWQLSRYQLIECLVLAAAGGASGLLLSLWATDGLIQFAGAPLDVDLSPDGRVLAFTFAISMLSAFVFGLVPAFARANRFAAPALKSTHDTGGGRSRMQTVLVAGQLALSLVLLTAAAVFLESLVNARKVDVGFQSEGRVSMSYDLRVHGYSLQRANAFHAALLDRVRALPGVRSASLAKRVPLGGVVDVGDVTLPGRSVDDDARPARAAVNQVWPGFFETMGIPILRGRALTAADLIGTPSTAVINETLAQREWPGVDPLGQRFSVNGTRGPFLEVVGVARDTVVDELNEGAFPIAYLPGGDIRDDVALLAWVDGDPGAALQTLEREVRALDGGVAVFASKTLAAHLADRMDGERGLSRLLSLAGAIALALAAIGLYGVMAYTVARRTREIGVRVALGAQRRDVIRLFLTEAGRLAAIGVIGGILPAIAVTGLLSSALVGVRFAEPFAIGAATVVLGTTSLLAAFVPTLRAVSVDPLVALRSE